VSPYHTIDQNSPTPSAEQFPVLLLAGEDENDILEPHIVRSID
jgi:hypothetical protein